MFERATEIDPDFARAWAALALTQAYRALFDHIDDAVQAAEMASRRAIELGPDVTDAYVARIMVMAAAGRFDAADAAFEKAVSLNPRSFEAHYQLGRVKWKQGELDRAVELFERAREIDPADFQAPVISIAVYRAHGKDKEARKAALDGVRAVELHLEQHPDNPRAYMLGSAALAHLGRLEEAIQYVESALRLDPESEDTQYNSACFYANIGEIDKALDCLERGTHDPDWMENDPDLDPLRDHPRFKELMQRARERRF